MKRFQLKSLATIAGARRGFRSAWWWRRRPQFRGRPELGSGHGQRPTLTAHDVTSRSRNLNDGMRANVLKDKKTRHEIVQQLIDQEVLVQEAEKEKMDDDPSSRTR